MLVITSLSRASKPANSTIESKGIPPEEKLVSSSSRHFSEDLCPNNVLSLLLIEELRDFLENGIWLATLSQFSSKESPSTSGLFNFIKNGHRYLRLDGLTTRIIGKTENIPVRGWVRCTVINDRWSILTPCWVSPPIHNDFLPSTPRLMYSISGCHNSTPK